MTSKSWSSSPPSKSWACFPSYCVSYLHPPKTRKGLWGAHRSTETVASEGPLTIASSAPCRACSFRREAHTPVPNRLSCSGHRDMLQPVLIVSFHPCLCSVWLDVSGHVGLTCGKLAVVGAEGWWVMKGKRPAAGVETFLHGNSNSFSLL